MSSSIVRFSSWKFCVIWLENNVPQSLIFAAFWYQISCWFFGLRYHLTPVGMAIIEESGDNRCWRWCGEVGMLLHCRCKHKFVQPLWKTVWWFLKDLEIEIPFDQAIPLLGIYPKNYKLFYYKDTCTCIFIAALFTIAKLDLNLKLHTKINSK